MTVLPPDGNNFTVVTPTEAVRVLCRHRPLEFRLVPDTLQKVTQLEPLESVAFPALRLEACHAQGWESVYVWADPLSFVLIDVDEWAACRAVAALLHEQAQGWLSGCDLKRPDREQAFWMISPPNRAPIIYRDRSPAEAALMAYAEWVRQRVSA